MATGPHQWWHHAALCDLEGSHDLPQIENLKSLILDLSRVGFRGVALRPTMNVLLDDSELLSSFITLLHRAGLKVLIHIPLSSAQLHGEGALSHNDATITQLRAAIKAGADGIDISLLDPPGYSRSTAEELNVTALIQSLHVELADANPDAILVAETLDEDRQTIRYHLQEHWFHHLRDHSLIQASWDSTQIRERVTLALTERAPLGQVTAWHWAQTRQVADDSQPLTYDDTQAGAWGSYSDEGRCAAMALFSLSLPGAAYLPFSHMGGRLVSSSGMVRRIWAAHKTAANEARILADALRIREERAMGTGSLAWVDNLPWCSGGVSVHMSAGIMVVLNTSDTAVCVPGEHRLLVASDPAAEYSPAGTEVPMNACAWFDTARVRPVAVMFND